MKPNVSLDTTYTTTGTLHAKVLIEHKSDAHGNFERYGMTIPETEALLKDLQNVLDKHKAFVALGGVHK